ncbi:uncharacterized protein LOC119909139 [Micropterus salmoides]|uniref:uncharacterized protein LOC119909139 n=1 Tax=Micropterus salmoides TaxID=27706 RepID=UPI0018EBDCC5|nr:uncharacterized protein LOC119909139 [Micropterus salmoides]
MALPKAVGYLVVLVVICYSLEDQGYTQSLDLSFEELMSTNAPHIHAREKRATTLNSSDYVLQVVLNISDLEHLRTLLNTFSPVLINNTVEINSIAATTVCSPNTTGYQCRCEPSFAWSYNSCIDYGACDAIIDDTCGCINGLPADGQYCQLNTSLSDVTYDIDLVLELRIPVSSVPSYFIELFRNTVRSVSLPYTINQSLKVIGLNFTTGCYPNSTGGLQCHCEEQFAWSCDQCNIYGACSNATSQTCGCINGLPSDGALCEPITNVTPCPTPTPNVTYDIDLVLELRIPVSSVPSYFIELFRNTVRSVSLPYTINQSLKVIGLNFTTGCYPNSTGGLQCHCEEQFAWSCDKCNIYGACSNATSQTCGCINGLPSDGALCEPITNVTPCPTPTPNVTYDIDLVLELRIPVSSVPSYFIELFRNTVRSVLLPYTINQSLKVIGLNFTTGCYPNSTGGLQCHCEEQFAWSCDKCNIYGACSNATSQTCGCINGLPSDGALCEPITNVTPCPTPTPNVTYDIDLVLELRIPVSSVPSYFIELFRNTVRSVSLPYTINQSLKVIGLNFTTGCYPNSTGGLQCHCEEQFAWSCDQCNIYGACSNATSQTCGCINGLPSDGALCEPITNVTPCPTPTPNVTYDIDLVLELRIPVSSVPSYFIELFRNTVRSVLLPYTINQSLKVIGLNFTTGCYPNSTGGLQCHCEEQFAWSCDKCNIYGACSNATSQTCGCINGLPSDGALCEPITNVTPCPTPTPNVTYDIDLVLELRIPVSSVPSYFIELFRNTVRSVLLPYTINQSLKVIGLNFTTGCYPNSTGGLQCHCEEQFAWSCDSATSTVRAAMPPAKPVGA